MGTTTIQVREETADRLHELKSRQDTYDDVIQRLLGGYQEGRAEETASTDLPESLDLPGSGDTLESRRAAVARLYQYLQKHGSAEKSELLDLVDADEVGYSSRESFWSNIVKSNDALAALPGVESPGEGGRRWRYTNRE